MLQTLKLPPDTRITNGGVLPAMWGEAPAEPVERQAYKDMWAAMKKGRAIRETRSTCHSELIIASISVSKGLGSLKFSSSFVYRVWDGKGGAVREFDGDNAVPKPAKFPARTPEEMDEASEALRSAFKANFAAWVARRVKI